MGDNLPNRVQYWLTEAKHDCFFVLGPENGPTERIGAIKIFLMGDSEPFRAMLQDSELAEKGDIRVPDVEPGTFRKFLKCVYGAQDLVVPKVSFEECVKLLYVTEKYLVNFLKAEISERLRNLFSLDQIFIALSHPICYREESLEGEILKCLKDDFEKIMDNDKFLELSETAMSWILQKSSFSMKETEIWNAFLRWAKHKAGTSDGKVLRSYIFPLLKYFRFLTMDHAEFWESVVSSEILNEEEVNDICRAFVSGESCSIEYLSNSKISRYDTASVSKNVITNLVATSKYAFISCVVSSVSDLKSSCWISKNYHWAGQLWCLRLDSCVNGGKDFGVFVGYRAKTLNSSCSVKFTISLINQTGKPNLSRDFTKTFSLAAVQWGYSSFHDWSELLNPDSGFIIDNSIILDVKLQLLDVQSQ